MCIGLKQIGGETIFLYAQTIFERESANVLTLVNLFDDYKGERILNMLICLFEKG